MLCVMALISGGCSHSTAHLPSVSIAPPAPGSVPASASLDAAPLPTVQPPPYLPGPLNGESVPRSLALRRPIAVIIDNYAPDARPQSGLSPASMVIETLVEGGITRLMALYLEQDAPKVGPIRSSRVYFDQWAAAFHATLMHVGGNDDAQALLWYLPPVFNLDESPLEAGFSDSADNPYWSRQDRDPPYAVYANGDTARSYMERHHQNWAYAQASIPHKRPASLFQRGHPGSLTISYVDPLDFQIPANPDYTVRYDFDRATDTYLRTVGGAPHIDAVTKKPLRPANVIVMRTGTAVADAQAGATLESITIPTIGTGPAWYFRDGKVSAGRWQQKDQFAPLRFLDRHGRPVAFNPGQTWIEVLPKYSEATWTFHWRQSSAMTTNGARGSVPANRTIRQGGLSGDGAPPYIIYDGTGSLRNSAPTQFFSSLGRRQDTVNGGSAHGALLQDLHPFHRHAARRADLVQEL